MNARVEGGAMCFTVRILHQETWTGTTRVLQMRLEDARSKRRRREEKRRGGGHLNRQIPELRLRFAADERIDLREHLHVVLVEN
jgi:hypothetical protein